MLSTAVVFLAVAQAARASVTINFDVQHVPAPAASGLEGGLGSKAPGDASEFNFGNLNDVAGADIYVATIQVDGQDYVVSVHSIILSVFDYFGVVLEA